jgi:hypothetical protein
MLYFNKTMDKVSLKCLCNNNENIVIITIIIPFAALMKRFYTHTKICILKSFLWIGKLIRINPALILTPKSHLFLKHITTQTVN